MTDQIETILLVDDDNVTNMMHRRIIEKSNRVRNVQVANDGMAALDLLQKNIADDVPLPELIFLDINMPRMGGFEFLDEYTARDLSGSGPMIIVMLSTSLLQSDHDRAASDPNVHSFSNKMMRSDSLVSLVDEYLAR